MAWLRGNHVDEAFDQRAKKFVKKVYRYNGEIEAEDVAQEILLALLQRYDFLAQTAEPSAAEPDGPLDLWLRCRETGELVRCSSTLLRYRMLDVLRPYERRRKSAQRSAALHYMSPYHGSPVRSVDDDGEEEFDVALVESAADTAERNEREASIRVAIAKAESAHPLAVAFVRAQDDGVTTEDLKHLGSRAVSAVYRARNRLNTDPRFEKERALATA